MVTKWELKTRDRYNVLQDDLNILGMLGKKNITARRTKLGDELLHGKR